MRYINKQTEKNDSTIESISLFDKIKEKIQFISNYIDNTHQAPTIVHTPSSEKNSIVKLDIATQVDTKIIADIAVNADILSNNISVFIDETNQLSTANLLTLNIAPTTATNVVTKILNTTDNIATHIETNANILSNGSAEACQPDSEDYPNPNTNHPKTSLVDLDVATNLGIGTGIVTNILHTVDNIAANVEINANILSNGSAEVHQPDSEDYPNTNHPKTSLVDLDVAANLDIGTGIVTNILHTVDNIATNVAVNADILTDAYSDSCDSEDDTNPYSIGNLLGLSVVSDISTNILTDVLHAVDNIAANVEVNANILSNGNTEACYPDSEDYPNSNHPTTNSLLDLSVAANVSTGLVTGILNAVNNIAANVEVNANILSNGNTEACYPDSEDYPNTNHPKTSLVDLDVAANLGIGTGIVTNILHTLDNISANVEIDANILSNNSSEESHSECNETGNTGSLITLLGGFGDDIITTANKNLEAILKNGTQDIADLIKDVSEVKIPESISVSDLGINTSVMATLDNTDANHSTCVAAIAVTTAVSLLEEDTTESVHTATSAATGFIAPLFESVGLTQAHDAITETVNNLHSGLDFLFGR